MFSSREKLKKWSLQPLKLVDMPNQQFVALKTQVPKATSIFNFRTTNTHTNQQEHTFKQPKIQPILTCTKEEARQQQQINIMSASPSTINQQEHTITKSAPHSTNNQQQQQTITRIALPNTSGRQQRREIVAVKRLQNGKPIRSQQLSRTSKKRGHGYQW